MSLEENKALVRRWTEARNTHDVETAVAQWAPAAQAQVRADFTGFTRTFPDIHIATHELIAEGDKVVCTWTFQGTQQGTFLGIPATGKLVNFDGIDIYTIADGKIASLARFADNLSLVRQLGVSVSWQGQPLP
jgi:steroid delta-isomerase-like uncharacterized protein